MTSSADSARIQTHRGKIMSEVRVTIELPSVSDYKPLEELMKDCYSAIIQQDDGDVYFVLKTEIHVYPEYHVLKAAPFSTPFFVPVEDMPGQFRLFNGSIKISN
jgi:hypothetical protein